MSAVPHGEICLSCGRSNCRVRYWEEIVELSKRPGATMPLEDAQRALYAARVSCFIRSGPRRRPGVR